MLSTLPIAGWKKITYLNKISEKSQTLTLHKKKPKKNQCLFYTIGDNSEGNSALGNPGFLAQNINGQNSDIRQLSFKKKHIQISHKKKLSLPADEKYLTALVLSFIWLYHMPKPRRDCECRVN